MSEDDRGGGISGFGVAKEKETPLSGTGGAAGPGTRAGEGQPSGEGIDTGEDVGSEAAQEARLWVISTITTRLPLSNMAKATARAARQSARRSAAAREPTLDRAPRPIAQASAAATRAAFGALLY
jgi:hypothetical protein